MTSGNMKYLERQIDWSLPQIRRLYLKLTFAVWDLGKRQDKEIYENVCQISLNITGQNNF